MAEIIKARVWQKVDTEANWNANPLILGAGEQAFVVNSAGLPINFKVGVGTKRFSELSWSIQYAGGQYIQIVGNVLPAPTVDAGYSLVGPGTYTFSGQAAIVAPEGRLSQLLWGGTSWSLVDMGALPSTPVDGVVEEGNTGAVSGNEAYQKTVLKSSLITEAGNNKFNPDFLMANTVVGSTGNVVTNPTTYVNALTIRYPVADRNDLSDTISGYTPSSGKYVVYKDAANNTVGSLDTLGIAPKTFTHPAGAIYMYIYIRLNSDSSPLGDIMINNGSSALPYEPFEEVILEIDGKKLKGDGGEAYDQSLNTFNNVEFSSVNAGQITASVLVSNLPSGSTQPPEVEANEVWVDTDNGNVLKVGV